MGKPPRIGFIGTALIGGLLILLPGFLIVYLVRQAVALVEAPAARLAAALPIFNQLGPVGDLLIALLLLVIAAFLAGLLAISEPARALQRRLRKSPLSAMPPFNFAHALATSWGTDEDKAQVVLVPSDQGQTLAFVFGPLDQDRICLYVPSAPNWMSGSISFARPEDVQATNLTFADATRIIMLLGSHSAMAAVGPKLGSMFSAHANSLASQRAPEGSTPLTERSDPD
jgi:uncharacterized membrane protein